MCQASWPWFARSLALALLMSPASALQAEEAGWGTHDRVTGYLGISGNVSFEDFVVDLPGIDFRVTDVSKPFGFSVRGGVRGNRWVALEAQFQWLDDFELETNVGMLRVESWIVTANAKLYPLAGRLEPYVLVGFGGGRATVRFGDLALDSDGLALRFGAGVDFHLTRRWSLELEGSYLLGVSDLDGFDVATIDWGLQFHF